MTDAEEAAVAAKGAKRKRAPKEGAAEGAPEAPSLTKRVLFERVETATGAKKKAVREIVDATLAQLGEALAKGESLVLPPLGRMAVTRTKGDKGTMMVRFRKATERDAKKDGDPLAEAAEAE
ncbi:MAG: HU family DNA-binding protein [Paracoccaceae bacterium]|nr:MAG: HU family DNA-binding protein [Paracoccaceae bacterium]